MAFFRFTVKSVSRGDNRSAPAAAAYRAGARIRDERTGELHNYQRRRDVTHTQILLPASAAQVPAWVLDRSRLWNEAEAAEHRRDSRVAREYQLSLPHELDGAQRLSLAQGFAQEIADRHGAVVDLCVHNPKSVGDPRNYHAHLLVTTRRIEPDGFGAKTGLELRNPDSLERGLLGEQEYWHLRERWGIHSNAAYHRAGLEHRVDHRTLAQRGLESSRTHKSFIQYQIERRRMRREITDAVAERYRERVQAAAEQARPSAHTTPAIAVQPATAEPAPAAERLTPAEPPIAPEYSAATVQPAAAGPTAAPSIISVIEDARRMGREAFLAQRQQAASPASHAAEHTAEEASEDATEEAGAARIADEDLAL